MDLNSPPMNSVNLEKATISTKTSSPKHPQSNGLAEKTVGIIKNLIKKSGDEFYLGLLAYRFTPLTCGKSCTAANFGQTCLFWKINFIHLTEKKSQDTEKQVKRKRRTTLTELHIDYQSYRKETW